MRVLHVIWDLGQGGAQRYLLDLLSELNGKVDNAVLVQSNPGPLSADVERQCSSVGYLHMNSGWNPIDLLKIIRFLKSTRMDIIHSHTNNILFNIALQLQSLPVIYTEHGGRLLERHVADRMIYKILHRPIRRFIAISEYMAGVMGRENSALSGRIKVIYNGVDTGGISITSPASPSALKSFNVPAGPRVGFIGRLVHQKGVEYFIETASHVTESMPGVQFIIIGDGPLLGLLKEMACKYGIEHQVHFVGYRKDAIALMKLFDVMLFTSRYEPFGLVIAEAMAAGVPLVAIDAVGAVSEIIRRDIDGIIVNGLDAKSAAAEIVRLLEFPELAQGLAKNAYERVCNDFSIAQNALKVESEYRSVLGCGGT